MIYRIFLLLVRNRPFSPYLSERSLPKGAADRLAIHLGTTYLTRPSILIDKWVQDHAVLRMLFDTSSRSLMRRTLSHYAIRNVDARHRYRSHSRFQFPQSLTCAFSVFRESFLFMVRDVASGSSDQGQHSFSLDDNQLELQNRVAEPCNAEGILLVDRLSIDATIFIHV